MDARGVLEDQGVRRRRMTAGAVAAPLLLIGCSAAGGESGVALGERVLSDLTSFERTALADKLITFGEYERAAVAESECLVTLGVTVDDPVLGDDGTFTAGWEVRDVE